MKFYYIHKYNIHCSTPSFILKFKIDQEGKSCQLVFFVGLNRGATTK